MHDRIPEKLAQSAFDFDALSSEPAIEVILRVVPESHKKSSTPKLPKTPGIYRISFSTGKFYIGSAVNLRKRYRDHLSDLRAGKHKNPIMQNLYNKHGDASFIFEVLEYVDNKKMLIAREQWYIDTMAPTINVCLIAGSTLGMKYSEQGRANISAARRGKKLSPEHIASMRAAFNKPETKEKMRPAQLGKKQPPEHIEKTAAARRGRKNSPEHIEKTAASKGGKPLSPEHKEKIRKAKLAKPLDPATIERIAASNRGKKQSPELIEKRIAPLRGKKRPPSVGAKISATKRAKHLAQQQAEQPPLF